MSVAPAFFVAGASLAAAGLNELIGWLLVYRTEDYQRWKNSFAGAEKKLEALKNSNAKKKKKDQRQEEQIKAKLRQGLSSMRTKTGILTAVLFFLFYQVLISTYDGQPVAKLPFVPLSFMTRFTHRNLPGEDYTDASVVFVYILCSTAFRSIVGRVFNFGPTKKMNAVLHENPFNKLLQEEELKNS